MKSQFISQLLVGVALLMVGSFSKADSQAAQTLAGFIGTQTLICMPSDGEPHQYALRSANGSIDVRARNSRQGTYSVYGAKVNQANLVVALMNSADGPLAEDALVIPLSGLASLAHHQASVIQGADFYREGYDGTKQTLKVLCHLN